MRAFIILGSAVTMLGLGSGISEAKVVRHKARTAHHAIHRASHRTAPATSCGGDERWDVKDGSDAGAPNVHATPVNGITIVDLNQLLPQAIGADGRMQEEKVIYRLTGTLRRFKHDADGDYHVVLADDATTPYSITRKQGGHSIQTSASGHSIVVEVPDPNCISGKHHNYGASYFLPQLQESRADFEAATAKLPKNRELGSREIPVTVTGVLFFDFAHGQTGHGLPHPSADADRRDKVVELHPVLCNDVGGYRQQVGKPAC